MRNLIFFALLLLFASCGTAQNSGIEIFEAILKEDQNRILEQIQHSSGKFHLEKLPFDGKSNFEGIDHLKGKVKNIKRIDRSYRIEKDTWTLDDLKEIGNQGNIREYFFDRTQKIVKAIEYEADSGVTDHDIFKIRYSGDKVISRGRHRGKITYQYSDSIVTVTDKSIYKTTEIETFIKSNDSIIVYYRYLPKPKVLKHEYVFDKNNQLSTVNNYHGGGVNSFEYFYNEKEQLVKSTQFENHHLLREPSQRKFTTDYTYYDFGGMKDATTHDEIKNTTSSNIATYSFKKDENENLIIKVKSPRGEGEYHLDSYYNLVYMNRTSKDHPPMIYKRMIQYY